MVQHIQSPKYVLLCTNTLALFMLNLGEYCGCGYLLKIGEINRKATWCFLVFLFCMSQYWMSCGYSHDGVKGQLA